MSPVVRADFSLHLGRGKYSNDSAVDGDRGLGVGVYDAGVGANVWDLGDGAFTAVAGSKAHGFGQSLTV